MNQQQILSLVRWMQATFGPFLISHGYVSASGLEMGAGVAVSVIPLIWGLVAHTQANSVAVVAQLASIPSSPVKAVVLEPTRVGRELAESIAGTNVVIAGTQAAEHAVKS